MSNPLNGILGPNSGGGSASGDVVGPASSTDNAIARWDLATGKLLQNSDLTISDPAAGVVTFATTAGTALAVKNTDPAATTGATVAGDPLTITAGNAVASTDTAGAAAGGSVTITAGAAARNTSGNADGGDIRLTTGAGIGTGTTGKVLLNAGTAAAPAIISPAIEAATGIFFKSPAGGQYAVAFSSAGVETAYFGGGFLQLSVPIRFSGNNVGIALHAAGVIRITNGGTSTGSLVAGVVSSLGGNGQQGNLRIATTTINPAGATTTATGLFPAKCVRLGVTYCVTTVVASGDGGTDMNVGDGVDPDLYGATIAFAAGTTGNLTQATADPTVWSATAGDIVFTCNGGTFSGGVIRVCAHYLDLTAPTS